MKVFISADLEGITGIAQQRQIDTDAKDYEQSRTLMTADVNAAVEAAASAGATEILVNDSHELMGNILIARLDQHARLISGHAKPMGMLEGLDSSFDAALFIGYHAKSGTPNAVADHTSSPRIFDCLLNGVSVGEFGINAATAGHFGVPVVMTSGDAAIAAEANELLGGIEAAIVKRARGRFAADCLPPAITCSMIHEAVTKALDKLDVYRPFKVALPATLETLFITCEMADFAESVPGVKRSGARSVAIEAADMLQLYITWRSMLRASAVPIW